MVSPLGSPSTSLLWVVFLGLSTLATPSRAQLELHVPAGLVRVLATEGGEVVLPAWYTLQGEVASAQPWETPLVIWFLEQKGEDLKQVLAYINGVLSGKPEASLVYTMPSRNVSMRLKDLREKDSGFYRCSVNIQDSSGTNRGHSSKTLELNVLVPPAPPSCHLLGVPRVGANVTLMCQSPRSKPTAQYQWEGPPPSSKIFFAPVADVIRGSLRLTNLSTSMSGVYICTAHNAVGSAQCNVTLEVSTAPGLAVEVKVPAEPLSAPVGHTAELTCSYSTSVGDNFALEWSFVQPGKPISESHPILYFTSGHLYPTGSKAERASLLQNPPTGGVATLKLTKVRASDTGTYLCQVNNPPDFYTNGLGLINLTVLVPPSRPLCSQSGRTSVGGSVALRCTSSEGAPKPVYNWVHLGSSPTPPPGSAVQDEVSGQLILTNLSMSSSGTYRCVATNQMGSASCELTLTVTDSSSGRVAGTLIGVLLGILLLSVAVFCLLRFQKERRKKPKETYGGNDLRVDAVAPGISEQTSLPADASTGLLERSPSASTVTTTKSRLPMLV
uniref:V-set and immunoglobulin domain-containing protein 2 n=1 Tax=Oryctolagus cuniculus TaxID=9986 RepID=A0A5F9C0V9_RABIT